MVVYEQFFASILNDFVLWYTVTNKQAFINTNKTKLWKKYKENETVIVYILGSC